MQDIACPSATNRTKYLQVMHSILQDEMANAQQRYKAFADEKRLASPNFKVGEKVWLLKRHIKSKRPSEKLDYRRLGPYPIKKLICKVAVKLNLPSSMPIHPVFHISLIEPVKTSDIRPEQPEPQPIEVEEEEEWEVERVLTMKMEGKGCGKKKCY
jgi:hypothetical protein